MWRERETEWWSEKEEGVREVVIAVQLSESLGSRIAKWSIEVESGREGGEKVGGRSVVRHRNCGRVVISIRPLGEVVFQGVWRSPPNSVRALGCLSAICWIAVQMVL